jgi:hypothetical protein
MNISTTSANRWRFEEMALGSLSGSADAEALALYPLGSALRCQRVAGFPGLEQGRLGIGPEALGPMILAFPPVIEPYGAAAAQGHAKGLANGYGFGLAFLLVFGESFGISSVELRLSEKCQRTTRVTQTLHNHIVARAGTQWQAVADQTLSNPLVNGKYWRVMAGCGKMPKHL